MRKTHILKSSCYTPFYRIAIQRLKLFCDESEAVDLSSSRPPS